MDDLQIINNDGLGRLLYSFINLILRHFQNVFENVAWNWEIFQHGFALRFGVLDYCWKEVEDEQ